MAIKLFFGIFFKSLLTIWLIFCQKVKLIRTNQKMGQKNFRVRWRHPEWTRKTRKMAKIRFFRIFFKTALTILIIFGQNVDLTKPHQLIWLVRAKKFCGWPFWASKNPKNGQNQVFRDFLQNRKVDLASFLPKCKTN